LVGGEGGRGGIVLRLLHEHHDFGGALLGLFVVEDDFVGHLEVVSLVAALDGIEDALPGHATEGGGEDFADAFFVDDSLLFLHEFGGEAEVGGELVLVPGMLSDLGDGDSLHWVDHEHTRDEVTGEL
jgi:hypothetical protein